MTTPEQCADTLEKLRPFDDPSLLTADELLALRVVREAIQAISNGEDLTPSEAGMPLKKRLIRHVALSYFAPSAVRPPREENAP